MKNVAVITVSEKFADSIPDWSKESARLEMLQDALRESANEFAHVCEERVGEFGDFEKRLRAALGVVHELLDEVVRVGGTPRHLLGLRARAGLTYQELAEQLDVLPGVVVRWEGGSAIPEPYLSDLARQFCVSVAWLTDNEEAGR